MQEYVNILLSLHPFTTFYVNGTIIGSNYPQLLLNIIPGKTQFGANVVVNAIGTAPNSTVYSGSIKFHKKILWLINSSVTLTSSTLKTQAGMMPIDGATGGIIDLENYMEKMPNDFRPFIKQTKFSFIPRGSSLALNDWNTNYTANLQGVDLFSTGKTEFEYVSMSPTIAEPHVTFDASKQFVINQLADNPISPNTFQSVFCGNQNVSLSNPQSLPLNWNVSDNMFGISAPTNTSAIISSAPTARSAILTISSTNTYPLRKRLISTCNLSISGPSTICSQATYTIANLPAGATVQWSTDNDKLQLISGQGTASVMFSKNGEGQSIIRSNIIIGSTNITLQQIVWIGTPSTPIDILGPSRYLVNDVYDITAITDSSTGYLEWKLGGRLSGAYIISGQGSDVVTIAMGNEAGPLTISVRAINDCGVSSFRTIGAMVLDGYGIESISPNPATDIVTIELEEETPDNQALSIQRVNKTPSQGVTQIQLWSATALIRTYKTDQSVYQISVSDLAAGMYFVRVIKDGKTYTQKLIKK